MFTVTEKPKSIYTKEHKSVVIELSEERYTKFQSAVASRNMSEIVRQMFEYARSLRFRTRKISVWFPNDEHARMQADAKRNGISFRRYAREVVELCIDELGEDEPCTPRSQRSGSQP